MINAIRDIREAKRLSQDAVAEAAGLTYSQFCRIEAGSGRTTQAEVDRVINIVTRMPAGTRRQVGRPFGSPEKQEAARHARETGQSVAAAVYGDGPVHIPPLRAKTTSRAKPDLAKALARKASPRSRARTA